MAPTHSPFAYGMNGLSGYVPFFNNADVVLPAVQSLSMQEPQLREVFAVDDGSTDGGSDILKYAGVRVFSQPSNLGRGAARNRAMLEAKGDLVVCCDATNALPSNFVKHALPWFKDDKVAAVYGMIRDPKPQGVVGRWRARHLFKVGHPLELRHYAPLITCGVILRRSAVLKVGNFSCQLRHSEDAELGDRLLAAGFDIVADPQLSVYCNQQNTLFQVLERYWRWNVGKDEIFGLRSYFHSLWFAVRTMAWNDLRIGDPMAAGISLLIPHYQLWKSLRMKR